MSHAVTRADELREETQALFGLNALFVITAAWWALALWPVEAAPVWLERTRFVCFGVNEHGLPDVGGWIGLIGGPLGMLAVLLVGWSGAIARLLRRARSSRPVAVVLTLLLLGCSVLVTGAAMRVQQVRSAVFWYELPRAMPPADYPRLDRAAPPLVLTNQHGAVIDVQQFRGRPVLVTFAYAHCVTICPLVVQDALRAQTALRGTPREPVVLVVTLDPWRDPPSRLPALANTWRLPADAFVLSGNVAAVNEVLDRWEVPRSRDEQTGEVTHPPLLYVVDASGRIAYSYSGGADAIISLLHRL